MKPPLPTMPLLPGDQPEPEMRPCACGLYRVLVGGAFGEGGNCHQERACTDLRGDPIRAPESEPIQQLDLLRGTQEKLTLEPKEKP